MASGFVPKTCWIADMLEASGKRLRHAWNRIDSNIRKHPCPTAKREAILQAIQRLETAGRSSKPHCLGGSNDDRNR